ncbi:MAG: hypothetical protein ACRCZG_03590, partial [Culicoidibacterales bacterium]
ESKELKASQDACMLEAMSVSANTLTDSTSSFDGSIEISTYQSPLICSFIMSLCLLISAIMIFNKKTLSIKSLSKRFNCLGFLIDV